MKNIYKNKGSGFLDSTGKKIYMVRCFECGKENYAMSVSSGLCAFCGYDANAKKETELKTK